MLQSIVQRQGQNPRTGIPIDQTAVAPDGSNVRGPGGNEINGHEYQINNFADLQYACTFPLPQPRSCAPLQFGDPVPIDCDCGVGGADVLDRPLCNGDMQEYARAYPATRILEVLKGYGGNSVVASVCPKPAPEATPADPVYGYNPAIDALADRLSERLTDHCLNAPLPVDEAGNLSCQVVEVSRAPRAAPCADDLPARSAVSEELAELTRTHLQYLGLCGGQGNPCDSFSLCEIAAAAEGAARNECLDDAVVQTASGYCYLDAMTDQNGDDAVNCDPADPDRQADCVGNPELLSGCMPSQRRRLRLVSPPGALDATGSELPWIPSKVVVVCPGS
jgi:hypothetical protein